MRNGCLPCRAGVDHCHGTVIEHPVLRAECTELDCVDVDPARHVFVLDCAALGCGCAEAGAAPALAG